MALKSLLTGRAAWASSFQYRDFRFLWGATVFHSLGMGMEQVAIGWLVFDLTDSPFMVGVASAARMAPFFFLGILSGAIADRVDRRIFLRSLTFGGGIVAAVMALVLITGVANVWYIIALAATTGCLWAFMMTVRQSYIFDLVGAERALNGLSLSAMSQRFGGVLGAVISGVAIAVLGIGGQYLVVAVTYLLAGVVLLSIRDVGQAAPTEHGTVWSNLVGYVRLIRENRTLMALMMLTASTEVFGFTHQSLLPVFARDVLGVGSVGLGFMTAVRQLGGMIALFVLANMGDFRRKGLVMFGAATAFGLGQIGFFWANDLVVFMLVLAFVNACASTADTLYKSLMQSNVTNEQRGRAMGSWVLSIGLAPVGHLGVGGMAAALGAPMALVINGSVLTLISVASALGLPRIRRLG